MLKFKSLQINRNLILWLILLWLFCFADCFVLVNDISRFSAKGLLNLALGTLPRYLMLLAPLFLFGRRSKLFYYLFFGVDIVFLMIGCSVRMCFHLLLDGIWIGIVLDSSPSEASWFIRQYAGTALACVLAGIGLFCLSRRLFLKATLARVTKMSIALGIICSALFVYHGTSAFQGMYAVYFLCSTFGKWGEYMRLSHMKTQPQIPSQVRLSTDFDDEIGVIVLGESATRSHWGLYGYERNTTPRLNERRNELTVFSDLVTPAGITGSAMRYIFTTRTVEADLDLRCTMAQILGKAGLNPVLFSNQKCWSDKCGYESFYFAGCKPLVFMNEQGETNQFDEVLIPYLRGYLRGTTRGMCFLHLIGSHEPAFERYPYDGAPFDTANADLRSSNKPHLAKDHYDNSIWYTDKVLDRIIGELEALHKPCWMAYVSDHGETPSSTSWRMMTDRDLWEVPFVVWTSKEFNLKHPQMLDRLRRASGLPLQSDQLMYGFLTLSGVEGAGNRPEEDFLNERFVLRSPRKIMEGKKDYSFK